MLRLSYKIRKGKYCRYKLSTNQSGYTDNLDRFDDYFDSQYFRKLYDSYK